MTKHRHNRVARWVFRIGATLCVLIVVATVVSLWRSFYARTAGWSVGVNYGSVFVFDNPQVRDKLPGFVFGPANDILLAWTARWTAASGVTVGRSYPTWMFLLATMLPTYLAWRRLRRKYPSGQCHRSGYNLAGNVTGACSECGAEAQSTEKPRETHT